MKRKYLTLCLIVLIICGGALRPVSAGEKVVVLLDWFVNPDHGPLFVALEKGFFKARGLDVEFQVPSNPNDPPKLVSVKKADLAVSYQPQHSLHVDRGLPLVRIATLVATPLNCLVVLAKGEIKDTIELEQALESLQNKRAEIGLPQESMSFKALHALRQKRMTQ